MPAALKEKLDAYRLLFNQLCLSRPEFLHGGNLRILQSNDNRCRVPLLGLIRPTGTIIMLSLSIQTIALIISLVVTGFIAGWIMKKKMISKQYRRDYLALEEDRNRLNQRMKKRGEDLDKRFYLLDQENKKIQQALLKSRKENEVLSRKIKEMYNHSV